MPAAIYGLSAYYLIAPAEASSNLARYDGVRYGLRVDGADTAEMMEADPDRWFRRRGEAAHHARHLRAVGGLLRRLLRQGAAGAHAHHPRLRRGLRALRRPARRRPSPTTAFALGAKTADPLAMYLNDVCTIPSNLAGQPAMSVPFGVGDDGCPSACRCWPRSLGEATMFRTAAVLEAAEGSR